MPKTTIGKKATAILIVGDVVVFYASLVLSLTLRYGALPRMNILALNVTVFIGVFMLWILGLHMYNLYGRRTVSTRGRLPGTLLQASLFNVCVAIFVFYIFPDTGVTPKTTLIIMLLVMYLLMYIWRVLLVPHLTKNKPESVIIIGKNKEHEELLRELNQNTELNTHAVIVEHPTLEQLNILVREKKNRIVVMDTSHVADTKLFFGFSPETLLNVRFINPAWLYEALFQKIPLPHVNNIWLFTHINYQTNLYDSVKRGIDIILSIILGILSLVFYPLVWMAIKIEDAGPIFIIQTRIGRGGKKIQIIKFRSMSGDDKGHDTLKSKLHVTRVGAFLRATRIDELPQLWNILLGDLSFIGPRPELVPLVDEYTKEIPFYGVRHTITPGGTGWAQLHQIADGNDPHHGTAVEATREKLSYDFYYLKHRSFILDISIMLRTIQVLISKKGS